MCHIYTKMNQINDSIFVYLRVGWYGTETHGEASLNITWFGLYFFQLHCIHIKLFSASL